MNPRYGKYNPKRKLLPVECIAPPVRDALGALADRVRYGGNPEHKRNPGDFGLTPPASPRQGKALCDVAGVFVRKEAEELLKLGFRRGLVSVRRVDGWPKNVWSMTAGGVPLEAQLENPERGSYHGYPMPATDPMHAEVIKRWNDTDV